MSRICNTMLPMLITGQALRKKKQQKNNESSEKQEQPLISEADKAKGC